MFKKINTMLVLILVLVPIIVLIPRAKVVPWLVIQSVSGFTCGGASDPIQAGVLMAPMLSSKPVSPISSPTPGYDGSVPSAITLCGE